MQLFIWQQWLGIWTGLIVMYRMGRVGGPAYTQPVVFIAWLSNNVWKCYNKPFNGWCCWYHCLQFVNYCYLRLSCASTELEDLDLDCCSSYCRCSCFSTYLCGKAVFLQHKGREMRRQMGRRELPKEAMRQFLLCSKRGMAWLYICIMIHDMVSYFTSTGTSRMRARIMVKSDVWRD